MNILGSIFYGVILGIFLVAFFFKRVGATPTLVAAVVAQVAVLALFWTSEIGFLWFNLIGCVVLIAVALAVQAVIGSTPPSTDAGVSS